MLGSSSVRARCLPAACGAFRAYTVRPTRPSLRAPADFLVDTGRSSQTLRLGAPARNLAQHLDLR
jgi:hypothetical protein